MQRYLMCAGIVLTIFLTAGGATAKDNRGSVSGTWDCQAHGGPQGDIAFILYLQQSSETVDGSISSPLGATQISSGTIRRHQLEIHFDLPQGSYILMGKLEKGKLSGAWSLDTDKGVWEGTKRNAPGK